VPVRALASKVHLRRWGPRALLVALIAAGTVPAQFLPAQVGLDPSWASALAIGSHTGLSFGKELVFTYGPLGYLAQLRMFFRDQTLVTLAFVWSVHLAAVALLLRVSMRSLGPVLGVLVAFVTARLLGATFPYPAEPVFLLWGLEALRPQSSPAWGTSVLWLGPPLASVYLYEKVNIGVAAMAVVILVAVGLVRERRRAAIFAAWLVASVAGVWLIIGQPLGSLPDYLLRSKELASGYTGALGLPLNPNVKWTLIVAIALLAIVAVMGLRSTDAWPERRRACGRLCVVAVSFLLWKEGFVRTNPGIFFPAMMVVLVAVSTRRPRLEVLGALLLPLVAFLAITNSTGSFFNPFRVFDHARDGARVALSASRFDAAVTAGRAAIKTTYAFQPATLDDLHGQTVHVEPDETSVIWAYPKLDWRPAPVFQAYAAYTDKLDDLDADFFSGGSAPTRVLRQSLGFAAGIPIAIDSRDAAWDSPDEKVALLCHYVGRREDGAWQVLHRVPNRCGPQRRISSVSAEAGAPVAVPPPPDPGSVVLVRFEHAKPGLISDLREALYRIGPTIVQLDAARARLMPGTADHSHILSVPEPADFGPNQHLETPAHTIAVRFAYGSRKRRVRYDFYSMPISGAGHIVAPAIKPKPRSSAKPKPKPKAKA
jgi:hypothetical protein